MSLTTKQYVDYVKQIHGLSVVSDKKCRLQQIDHVTRL